MRALVTGATGYVGGRLVPQLLNAGMDVVVLARHPERLRDREWIGRVTVVAGDANDPEVMARAVDGVDVAYYLMHSIGAEDEFGDLERATAHTFATAAVNANVGRIVYLGGLAHDAKLSQHLKARADVGEILLASGVPTAALGAGVIIGSGSLSFEMLRYLTERLPAMITPRWVRTRIQPIGIRDVLRYLVACATELPPDVNRWFDIGGPDVLTYEDMMHRYAAVAELPKRIILPINILSPKLSSRWIGLVTPVPASIARPLVDSLKIEVVCDEHDIANYIPDPPEGLLGFEASVALALQRVREAHVSTRWSSASYPGTASDPLPSDPDWAGGSLYTDEREAIVDATPEAVWRVIEGIGGNNGWYSFPLAWEVRGLLDRAVGGVGLRRGRRDPRELMVGEPVDFWRVEERIPGELLRLRAEMKMPGLAWLELGVSVNERGQTVYHQRAIYHPKGLMGHAYWYSVMPFHGIVFGSMVTNITGAAKADAGAVASGG